MNTYRRPWNDWLGKEFCKKKFQTSDNGETGRGMKEIYYNTR